MAIKKLNLLLLGVFTLLSFGALAQDSGIYNINDSSVISTKRQAQHNEFMNNAYDYPANPRNQMEFGISGGLFTINGDVPAQLPTFGFGAHFRKALGYVFSLRLQYNYGMAKGLNWKASDGFLNNPAWSAYSRTDDVYYNYKSTVQELSLQGLFSFNNIRFHKNKTSMVFYGGAGLGGTIYDTKVNALNGNAKYNFGSISGSGFTNRKDIRKELKDMLDDSYETPAQSNGNNRAKLFGQTFKPSANLIAGIAFKLGKRVNLALENKLTITKDDLMDGQQYQDGVQGVLTGNFDTYNYTSVGLNFNLGKKGKSIEPLWWINPLSYAYSELNNPKHMKLPKPVLDDEDNDGVADQFDRCPGTPANVKVDTQGCPLDTDGDGVPDHLDKELITPTYCQPVDADGIGKCPDPECCKNIAAVPACNISDLPSISFKGNTNSLSSDAKAMLATVASKLKNNADCSISITGYPVASKASQALCNRRVSAIKAYLTEVEGISGDRVDVSCEVGGGAANTVDIKAK